jgi:hypothetical protein
MHYDYYIASRYRNKEDVLKLARLIREAGKSVYCFIESRASVSHVGSLESNPEEDMKKFESIENWQTDPAVRDVFETDMESLRASDTLVLLLPAGKSSHIESGAAYGMGKHLVVIGEQKETESLYLIFNEFYDTIEDFIKNLK